MQTLLENYLLDHTDDQTYRTSYNVCEHAAILKDKEIIASSKHFEVLVYYIEGKFYTYKFKSYRQF